MANPLSKGAAMAPPTLGEGCVRRYDPAALSDHAGTDFPGAAELWQASQLTEVALLKTPIVVADDGLACASSP